MGFMSCAYKQKIFLAKKAHHYSLEVNRFSTIVCTSKIGNLSVQVGVPPAVGSEYGHFEVVRGWGLSLLDRWG